MGPHSILWPWVVMSTFSPYNHARAVTQQHSSSKDCKTIKHYNTYEELLSISSLIVLVASFVLFVSLSV